MDMKSQLDDDQRSLDKRTLGPKFRARLLELIAKSGLSRAAFAIRIGIDRSALTQLLSSREPRLPRAETLAVIARSEGVSVDWLLGMLETDTLATEIAAEIEIEERASRSDDSRLLEWRREAQGAKIRYVPAYLPDLMRLPEITKHEIGSATDPRLATRVETDRETLALSRTPEADMEVCMPRQRLELLAQGAGFYDGVTEDVRRRQLERIAMLTEELYPAFRLFLYDGRAAYSAAYTVFGVKRAALYVGDMYFVLSARAQIQALTRHFDGLIRSADVDARNASKFTRGLLETL